MKWVTEFTSEFLCPLIELQGHIPFPDDQFLEKQIEPLRYNFDEDPMTHAPTCGPSVSQNLG